MFEGIHLDDALGAGVVLQAAGRGSVAEGNLGNAYLPQANRQEPATEVHGDLDGVIFGAGLAAVAIKLLEGQGPQVSV